jgi:hypothetical protein
VEKKKQHRCETRFCAIGDGEWLIRINIYQRPNSRPVCVCVCMCVCVCVSLYHHIILYYLYVTRRKIYQMIFLFSRSNSHTWHCLTNETKEIVDACVPYKTEIILKINLMTPLHDPTRVHPRICRAFALILFRTTRFQRNPNDISWAHTIGMINSISGAALGIFSYRSEKLIRRSDQTNDFVSKLQSFLRFFLFCNVILI